MYRGLGALVAEKFAAEGSNVAINYVSNEDRAKETAAKIESQYKVKVVIIQGVRLRLSLSYIILYFFPSFCIRLSVLRKQVKLIAAWGTPIYDIYRMLEFKPTARG
jgi:NAD(P)-dependent dehydrogenase (short-subunit alcohol dehydrogenase family)